MVVEWREREGLREMAGRGGGGAREKDFGIGRERRRRGNGTERGDKPLIVEARRSERRG